MNTGNSTAILKMVCAIIFILFSFVYLYFYQGDILAAAQHVLSKGATHYDKLIGALLITLSLLLLQCGVSIVCRLSAAYHALTYFPSLLILTFLTDIGPDIDNGFCFGSWSWGGPLVLLVWAGLVSVIRKYQQYMAPSLSNGFFSRSMWSNMAMMVVMFLFVGMASNGNAVFHYRMRIEACLSEHDYASALATGRKSLETDSNLTMLRMYALAREGRLGDELFTFPIAGSSDDIIPCDTGCHSIVYPNDSIFKFLGAKPARPIKAQTFLWTLIKRGRATSCVKDYMLCGYLIDRDLDSFVRYLPQFYEINDSLPKHYREALILYTRLRSNPAIVYHNVVMDTDFDDLTALEKQYTMETARRRKVFGQYAETYWWYYKYM